jgi:osmotically-inducible protein OsmY
VLEAAARQAVEPQVRKSQVSVRACILPFSPLPNYNVSDSSFLGFHFLGKVIAPKIAEGAPSEGGAMQASNDRLDRGSQRGFSLIGAVLFLVLIVGLVWVTYLVSTRGWEQAKEDVQGSVQGAVYAAKETSEDAALTTKVKTALTLSKRIPADKIDVDTENGVVTLRGETPSEETRTLAESIARDVPGVTQVQNHLFVTNPSN